MVNVFKVDPGFSGKYYSTYEGPPTNRPDQQADGDTEDIEAELERVKELIKLASKAEGLGCQTDALYQ